MSSAVYVEEAAGWAHKLTLSRVRGPGDYERAMRSLVEGEEDAEVDPKILRATGYSTLWGFRFRRPKRVFADVYFELKHAYEALPEAYREWDAKCVAASAHKTRKQAAVLLARAILLERSDAALDRQQARIMRARAEELVGPRPKDRDR